MISIDEITRIIPHRPPALAVDRVSKVEPGQSLVAHKVITADDTSSAGHACPTGKLIESWAQAAVLLVRWRDPNPDVLTGHVDLLSGIRNVAVIGSVYRGDVVEHQVELVRAVDDAAVLTGSSLVGGLPVLRIGSLTVAHRPREVLGEIR